MNYFRFAAENARAQFATHTRCKCGVPLSNRDKVIHCAHGFYCPRKHEHDEVKWQRVKQQATSS